MDDDMTTNQTAAESSRRRRRPHTRSRNGCVTCKQRHIRCDELEPICTNCLVRGGACGYPVSGSASGSPSAVEGAGVGPASVSLLHQRLQQLRDPSPVSPDPYEAMPLAMPYRSMELFHHFTRYRTFSRTLVLKNPNATCNGFAMSNAASLRICLLIAAMHYSWIAGSLDGMEETYLHHKLEAIRVVNEQISDPVLGISDACIDTIVVLALVESNFGAVEAAEAHLGALETLMEKLGPEGWQARECGLVQRVALLAGSFIAADGGRSIADVRGITDDHQNNAPRWGRATGPLFSVASIDGTALSPFFIGSPPDIEACKSDLESHVVFNALRRLSGLSVHLGTNARSDSVLSPEQRDELLHDTDAYIASFLFRPSPVVPGSETAVMGNSSMSSSSSFTARGRKHDNVPLSSSNSDPYPDLDTMIFPSSSRSWALAAYFFLHLELRALWTNHPSTETHMLFLLLQRLQVCLGRTERAMEAGAYNKELWLWQLAVGAYAAASLEDDVGDGLGWTGDQRAVLEARVWFGARMAVWSRAHGVAAWDEVRTALQCFVWRVDGAAEEVVRGMWERALGW